MMTPDLPPHFQPSTAKGRVLVFDSGVGGLTVAAEIAALGPRLSIDYAADSGFFPYGDKSDAALRARLPQVAKALVEAARPDVLVIACNTASTLALPEVRSVLDIPVVGTVPAIKPAIAHSRSGVIGLLATPGTISRTYTSDLIAAYAGDTLVIQHGSLELVKLAEAFARGQPPPLEAFAGAQAPLFEAPDGKRIDTIVLACTHFPLVRAQLRAAAPRPVTYIDSGAAIARQTIRVLPASAKGEGKGGRGFITSARAKHPRLETVLARYGYGDIQTVVPVSNDMISASLAR